MLSATRSFSEMTMYLLPFVLQPRCQSLQFRLVLEAYLHPRPFPWSPLPEVLLFPPLLIMTTFLDNFEQTQTVVIVHSATNPLTHPTLLSNSSVEN
ncbi:hypothetical protein K435DRAFT_61139 [Dendrothele bispora CBS 962.96]|uniref:Uncharacterized protein n=1 Tax=Dendrothele bispora (strain CBS 962.96) TaxID=1314807 RepID=A0A4S8KRD2_DENBC|nr:hypothetical protein K435DRAFT_61139 [Dendrothele bispora CBS 962.96]